MTTVINPEYLSMPAQVQKNKEDIAALKESGLIMTPRGEYSDDTQYNKNDLVDSNGSSYLAIIASLGYPPASNPDRWQLIAEKGDPGARGPAGTNGADGADGKSALTYYKTMPTGTIPETGKNYLIQSLDGFNRTPKVGDNFVLYINGTVSVASGRTWIGNAIVSSVEGGVTFSYDNILEITGATGAPGATKICHNIMFSKSPSQSEMIQCSFSIVDESPTNYENLNFVYTALTGSHINAPQNHRFPATGFYMKNYISMPITSIRWSAATLRISYIDTTLEQPAQADYICTLTDTCTDCQS